MVLYGRMHRKGRVSSDVYLFFLQNHPSISRLRSAKDAAEGTISHSLFIIFVRISTCCKQQGSWTFAGKTRSDREGGRAGEEGRNGE